MGASRIETEYNEINSRNGWGMAFQEIKEKSEQEATEKKFTLNECNKLNNRRFNRYRDVSPYDHSRIILRRGEVDYVNANLVKLDRANRRYILTQGPLQNTVGHFWLMVWEQNSAAILMLNKLIEKRQVKCHQYWPMEIGPEHCMQLEDVGLTVEYLKCEKFTNFLKRTFRLTDTESTKSREVIQFHYTTWPDFYIPTSPIAFLQFLKQVRDSGALNADVGPAIVHCSAGIGRSGTFCLVDTCLVLIEKEGENRTNVADILLELRQSRMGLIQTSDQLYFSYQAIIEGIKHFNDPSFNDYEEVPVISYEDNIDKEEVSPPPPPPRHDSLVTGRQQNLQKPLPLPVSVSAYEFLQREARNNSENLERTRNANQDERPLPPLPISRDGSLERVDESHGDIEIDDDDHDEDDDDEEEIEENYSDEENDKVCDDIEPMDGCSNTTNRSTSLLNGNSNSSHDIEASFDADGTLPPSPAKSANTFSGSTEPNSVSNSSHESQPSPDNESTSTTNAELRRRKRQQRKTEMEEKIKDIKRKQEACEAAAEAAPKKRRHHPKKTASKKSDN